MSASNTDNDHDHLHGVTFVYDPDTEEYTIRHGDEDDDDMDFVPAEESIDEMEEDEEDEDDSEFLGTIMSQASDLEAALTQEVSDAEENLSGVDIEFEIPNDSEVTTDDSQAESQADAAEEEQEEATEERPTRLRRKPSFRRLLGFRPLRISY